jgi:hypothetical protein
MNPLLPTQLELATLAAALPAGGTAENRVSAALALWQAAGARLEKESGNVPLDVLLSETLPTTKRPKKRELLYREFREQKAGARTIARIVEAKQAIDEEKRSGVSAENALVIRSEFPQWVEAKAAKTRIDRATKGGQARAAKKATTRKK